MIVEGVWGLAALSVIPGIESGAPTGSGNAAETTGGRAEMAVQRAVLRPEMDQAVRTSRRYPDLRGDHTAARVERDNTRRVANVDQKPLAHRVENALAWPTR